MSKKRTTINLSEDNWEWAVEQGNIRNLSAFVDTMIASARRQRDG